MSNAPITTASEPDGAPRLPMLDILRGVAILGILFMNINDMGQSMNASFGDVRHLGWAPADQVAWWLREVLADGTARGLLEMLFGAGMAILTGRIAERASEGVVLRRYYVRNIVLFGFGLAHVFLLLWPGEILHTYAIAALIAFLFRQLDTTALFMLGASFAAYTAVNGVANYQLDTATIRTGAAAEARARSGVPLAVADRAAIVEARLRLARLADARAEAARAVVVEDTARRGTFRSWAGAQWQMIIDIESTNQEVWFVWEAGATMLIGIGLFRLGIVQGARSRRWYLGMMALAYGIGVPLRLLGAWEETRFDTLPQIHWSTQEIARLAMTLGHVALLNLLAKTALGTRLLRPFAAAGRTALSIYVAQTLICLWVLYPPFALALYGKMGWASLMAAAALIDAVLLVGANAWVRRFDIAPVEWAWRSLAEGRALPWHARQRRGAPAGQSRHGVSGAPLRGADRSR